MAINNVCVLCTDLANVKPMTIGKHNTGWKPYR